MIRVPCPAMLVLVAAFLIHVGASPLEVDDTLVMCRSDADDCVSGYTSLLQSDMNLVGHQRAAARETRVELAPAKVNEAAAGTKTRRSKGKAAAGTQSLSHGMIVVLVAMAAVVFYFTCFRPVRAMNSSRTSLVREPSMLGSLISDPSASEEVTYRIHDNFEEDTYSLAIALMVRDLRSLAIGEGKPGLKYGRLLFALGLVALTIGIQVSIMVCTKQFVTPNQVADIRDAYDQFESTMYGEHTYLNENGKTRGKDGYFNATAFDDLDDDAKQDACNIPFSQLNFLFLILMVWSITCMAQLKKCAETFLSLIVISETKSDMRECLTHWSTAHVLDHPDHPNLSQVSQKDPIMDENGGANVQVITGLTLAVKLFLSFCILVPEFACTSYILWLGSRWLTATNDFGNLVCNAVALEFTLQLKAILFLALASDRNKREVASTGIAPAWGREAIGYAVYFNTLIWALVSFAWVYLYIFHFQQVLPDYKWDVHQVCNPYLLSILKASGGDD